MTNVISLFPNSKRSVGSIPPRPITDDESTELFDQIIDNPFAHQATPVYGYNTRLVDIFNILNNVLTWDFDKNKNEYYVEHAVYGFSTITIEDDNFIFEDEFDTVYLRTISIDVITNILK